uniref:Glycoprotein n=1 Tax=Strongyloides papillosus TaxID=174720 RepID=A0A0N5B9C1_STREA
MITIIFLVLFSLSSVKMLQICPTLPVRGELVDIKICRNIENGDIYWNSTVKLIQVNFMEEYCESFYEDVYLSDSRLIRFKTDTMYMPSEAFYRPSCVPKEAVYLLNGLFYVPVKVGRPPSIYQSNYEASKLAIKICDNYRRFVTGESARSVSETRDFIRRIYGRDNVTGYISQGNIYLLNCMQIPREGVIYSRKIRDYCYERIPVIVSNSTIMFTTIGIDLEVGSIGEECGSLFPDGERLWENNFFLRCAVIFLLGALILLLFIDIIGIVSLIKESRADKDTGLEYNDFLFKLANESIRENSRSKISSNSLGFADDASANVNVNLNGIGYVASYASSSKSKKSSCIQFHPAPPRPHPFDSILNTQDSISMTSIHV